MTFVEFIKYRLWESLGGIIIGVITLIVYLILNAISKVKK